MRDASDCVAHSGRRAQRSTAKGMDFFRVHYGHKGDAAVKFKALSSACQIVNERLLAGVQPVQKTKESSCLSNHHWSRIMQP